MEIFTFIIIIVGCILCYKLSTAYSEHIENKYYQGCINWWWSVVIAVFVAAALLTIGEKVFWLFIILTLGSCVVSAWLVYKRMIGFGATPREARLGGIAQIASAVGIAAAIIFILLLLFGGSNKRRRR